MSTRLQIALLFGLAVYHYILFQMLKKKRLNLKYSLLWIFSGFLMLIAALFPKLLVLVSKCVGISTPSNTLFAIILFFMMVILMTLTAIVSELNEQVKRLTQTIALLEKRVREKEQMLEHK